MALGQKNVQNAIQAISNGEEFTASAMSGRPVDPNRWPETGRLPQEWADRLNADRATYIVYSYNTPIGWVASDGTPVVPDVRYSVTTTNHQTTAAVALFVNGSVRSSL